MSKNRLIKYEKILHIQQRQIDLIKQQIGTQRNLIDLLTRKHETAVDRQRKVGQQVPANIDVGIFMQQCDLQMIENQRNINALKTEIANADEKLDHLLHTFRDANQKLKSWEKLVEQETEKAVSDAMHREMKIADERYLATQFAGDRR